MSRYWIGCAPCSDPPYIKLSLCTRWLHVSVSAGSYTFIWYGLRMHVLAKILPMLTVMVGWTSLYHDYVEPASFFPAGRLTKCSRNVRLSYGIQGFNFLALESLPNTELFVWSVAKFCYVFQGKLQGPAWAVGSYSYSQSAGGIYHLQNLVTDRTNSSVHFQRLKETLHIENCDVWQEWQIKVLPKQVTASFEFD